MGPANSAKTFLLQPLTVIFETFSNPATATFAWVGAEHSEAIFLNDFRWSPQIIPWHDLLLMLEGQPVHLPALKSHFCKNILFDNDTPIFGTSKHRLVFVRGGVVDERETEMTQVRWRIFHLSHQIRQQDQRAVPPYGKCFARLVLSESVTEAENIAKSRQVTITTCQSNQNLSQRSWECPPPLRQSVRKKFFRRRIQKFLS